MVDAIEGDLGDVATIFVKKDDDFVRISTSIEAQNAVNTIKTVSEIIISQGKSVDKTKEKFDGIALGIEEVKKATKALNESKQVMENRKDELISIVQGLSAIAEENAAATEEVSAAVQEQTDSMEEISNGSDGLASLVGEMQEKISVIKS